jgi:hypothetical protein
MKKSYTKNANIARLQAEIEAAIPGLVHHIDCEGTTVSVHFIRTHTAEEDAQVDSIVAAHSAVAVKEMVQNRIVKSMQFGQQILIEYTVQNVLEGITQSGKTKQVVEYCAKILMYIQSGSLVEVCNEVDRLIAAGIPGNLAPYITESKLLAFKAKIQAFLATL